MVEYNETIKMFPATIGGEYRFGFLEGEHMNIVKTVIPLEDEFPFKAYDAEIGRNNKDSLTFHWHECLEISFVKSGEGMYYVNGREFSMQKGDVVIFNNMEPHAWCATSSEPMLQPVIVFNPSLIWSGRESLLDYEYLKPFFGRCTNFTNKLPCNHPATQKIYKILKLILDEYCTKPPVYYLMIKAKLLEVMTYLIRYFQSEKRSSELIDIKKKKLMRIQKIVDYVDEKYQEEISIADVAKLTCMNSNYFSTFFKSVTGLSFTDYLTRLRVSKAAEMLDKTDDTCTSIAFACGFNSMSNFYRAFKKVKGASPADIRKK